MNDLQAVQAEEEKSRTICHKRCTSRALRTCQTLLHSFKKEWVQNAEVTMQGIFIASQTSFSEIVLRIERRPLSNSRKAHKSDTLLIMEL